jgi:hypothetical protein
MTFKDFFDRQGDYKRIFVNRGWKSMKERGYATRYDVDGVYVRSSYYESPRQEDLIFVPWSEIKTLSDGSSGPSFFDRFDRYKRCGIDIEESGRSDDD